MQSISQGVHKLKSSKLNTKSEPPQITKATVKGHFKKLLNKMIRNITSCKPTSHSKIDKKSR